ncbi:aldo/keto reductase [Halomonas cerina]|uniref:Diketogulonate reductase-like aldo/keto reductase n=1 Tax=Halomonas cerina TaxID=447424 RepID=A0A839V9R0_9GAMM|nr:aldo/keto reductase [Halomonas cerina]MBB3190690.1 diketogulonate reductase-like aldo/keto reductase [Halomonas cerina]
MAHRAPPLSRRLLLHGLLSVAAMAVLPPLAVPASSPLTRRLSGTDVHLPRVGLGSWITFNVGSDPVLLEECTAVMAAFFTAGGRLIDSSPMYGSSQATIGHGLAALDAMDRVYAADKVWTTSPAEGPAQIEASRREWGVPRFDLLQVHNLLAWERHLETLQAMKASGEVRHLGITTSHGRRHDRMEHIMRHAPLDFVQLTYNIVDREAERRLLPLARERGIGVIANRPFQQKRLIRRLADKPLPPWSGEIGATSWAQFILKFIISHPAVTCAIPATTRVDHVRENLATASDPLPDHGQRRRMAEYVRSL